MENKLQPSFPVPSNNFFSRKIFCRAASSDVHTLVGDDVRRRISKSPTKIESPHVVSYEKTSGSAASPANTVRWACEAVTRLNGFGSARITNSTICFREQEPSHRQRKTNRTDAAVFPRTISPRTKSFAAQRRHRAQRRGGCAIGIFFAAIEARRPFGNSEDCRRRLTFTEN